MVLDMGQPIRILDVAQRLIDESHRPTLRSSSPACGQARARRGAVQRTGERPAEYPPADQQGGGAGDDPWQLRIIDCVTKKNQLGDG